MEHLGLGVNPIDPKTSARVLGFGFWSWGLEFA